MSLKHPPFAASPVLLSVQKGGAQVRRGQRSAAVRLIQAALIQLGHRLPQSVDAKGVPDGTFGAETEEMVKAFQTKLSLEPDGAVGPKTLAALDAKLTASETIKLPPMPRITSTREYKTGTDDPSYLGDVGAGGWKSKPVEPTYLALMASLDLGLATFVAFGKDATNHLRHYFAGSGKDYRIDLEAMLREVPSARQRLAVEVKQAQTLIEMMPEGTHSITSQQMDWGYNLPTEDSNWYYAIGGYKSWGKGVVNVSFSRGVRRYSLDFEYHLKDRYNWDGGKQVEIPTPFSEDAPLIITDHFMGEFHRQGLAREFFCVGSVRRKLSWEQGVPISTTQLLQAAGGRG